MPKRSWDSSTETTKAAQAVAAHQGSAKSAQKLLRTAGPAASSREGPNAWASAASRALKEISDKYVTKVALKALTNTDVDFHVVKLPLVLTWFCSVNAGFADLLLQSIRGKAAAGVYLYCDEVTPGAVLAPLNNRKSYLWYLAFESWGYFLHEDVNWICVAIMKHTSVDKVAGGLSAAVRALAHHLFDSNVEVIEIDGQTWLLKLCLFNLEGDADAMRAIFSAMGAGGVRPCVKCTNCLYKRERNPPAGFITICESNAALFKPMKSGVLWRIIDYLKHVAETQSNAKLEAEETKHGLHWNPDGLLADVTLRGAVLPSHATGDPMHVFFSNGIASFELGWFMGACNPSHDLEDLRTFANMWEADSSIMSAIHPSKYKSTQYKGSASECKSLVPLVCEFARAVVNDPGLALHVASMVALGDVCRELQLLKFKRDSRKLNATKLATLLQVHLEAFKQAYGEEGVRPKHHQAMHLPGEFEEADRAMDCFTCERRNKIWKLNVAPFCPPAALEKHSLAKLLLLQRDALKEAQYKEQYMNKPSLSDRTALQYGWREAYLAESCWRKGQTFKVGNVFSIGAEAFEVTGCISDGAEIYLLCDTYRSASSLATCVNAPFFVVQNLTS